MNIWKFQITAQSTWKKRNLILLDYFISWTVTGRMSPTHLFITHDHVHDHDQERCDGGSGVICFFFCLFAQFNFNELWMNLNALTTKRGLVVKIPNTLKNTTNTNNFAFKYQQDRGVGFWEYHWQNTVCLLCSGVLASYLAGKQA